MTIGERAQLTFAKTWWLGILLEDRHHPPLSRHQRDTDRTSKLNRNRKPHQEERNMEPMNLKDHFTISTYTGENLTA